MSITGAQIVSEVEKFQGDPYVYGAAGPSSFDCSGLIQYALTQLGMSGVPRTSEEQWSWIQQISKSDLQPGDLVFAQFPGDNAPPGHVGVYVGNGEVFSAQDPSLGIGDASLASWGSNVYGYGRVPGVNGAGGGSGSGGSSGGSSGSNDTADINAVLSGVKAASGLVHDVAAALNEGYQLVEPGQTWRVVFAGLGTVTALQAFKSYGSKFSVAVLLAGGSSVCWYMALRAWPMSSSGHPVRPAVYLSEVTKGKPPAAGPAPKNVTGDFETGLMAVLGIYAAGQAAKAVSSAGGLLSKLLGSSGSGKSAGSDAENAAEDIGEDIGEAG